MLQNDKQKHLNYGREKCSNKNQRIRVAFYRPGKVNIFVRHDFDGFEDFFDNDIQ